TWARPSCYFQRSVFPNPPIRPSWIGRFVLSECSIGFYLPAPTRSDFLRAAAANWEWSRARTEIIAARRSARQPPAPWPRKDFQSIMWLRNFLGWPWPANFPRRLPAQNIYFH